MFVLVPVSPGELLDKVSILEVKVLCFKDEKQAAAEKELELLLHHKNTLNQDAEVMDLYINLRLRNRWLFNLEDVIREQIKHNDHEAAYDSIQLIHKYNKERAEYKAKINELLGATIKEVKQYSGE